MRWKSGRRSDNIEDRRGQRLPGGATGIGGGFVVLAILAYLFLGRGAGDLVQQIPQQQSPRNTPRQQPVDRGDDEAADFVSVILAETEDTWEQLFANAGYRYSKPTLVLYEDMVQSACGVNSAQTGPFYCPGDQKVYLDLSFLRELQRLGARGDFAFAYVVSHEVGHHVQTLQGIDRAVRAYQARVRTQAERNQLQVLMELQADCYAGLWARNAHERRGILERGDVEEGLNAAAAIGDDRLQRQAGRRVQPEAFTHGSSQQRVEWFRRGLETGRIDACDTFGQAGVRLQ